MNIEGFSEKTAELLFDNINIKSISDLYRIKKEQLLTLPKFGDKKADNLINAIEKSKSCSLASFIYSSNRGKDTPTSKVGEELPLADRQLHSLPIITLHFLL